MAKWFRSPLFRKKNQMLRGFQKIKRGEVFSTAYAKSLARRKKLLVKYGVPIKEINLLMGRWPAVKAAIIADGARCNCSINVAKHILDLMLEYRATWINSWVERSKKREIKVSVKEAKNEGIELYDNMLSGVSRAIEHAKPTPDKKAKNWSEIDDLEGVVRRADAILLPERERNSEIIVLPKLALMTTGEIVSKELKRLLGAKYDAFVKEDASLNR